MPAMYVGRAALDDRISDSNGILLWRYEYVCDEQGNMLEKRQYRSDGEIEAYYEYVYQRAEEKASAYE